ncbi:hypothetical protein NE237_004725 [Protea cynaroides]|uniref:Uncharacterized protein n=1 Tax=Protea cynaroides TaxID=273540 RepID=A0A9Q0KJY2_9MAGN|nr:hypothetical protein NE237_004725 [Protea cynaroides]
MESLAEMGFASGRCCRVVGQGGWAIAIVCSVLRARLAFEDRAPMETTLTELERSTLIGHSHPRTRSSVPLRWNVPTTESISEVDRVKPIESRPFSSGRPAAKDIELMISGTACLVSKTLLRWTVPSLLSLASMVVCPRPRSTYFLVSMLTFG